MEEKQCFSACQHTVPVSYFVPTEKDHNFSQPGVNSCQLPFFNVGHKNKYYPIIYIYCTLTNITDKYNLHLRRSLYSTQVSSHLLEAWNETVAWYVDTPIYIYTYIVYNMYL